MLQVKGVQSSFAQMGKILDPCLFEDKVEKDRILATYLNIIEYGDNLYGIKDAAKYYFKKDPAHLSARESAFIAMLLPSPKRYAQSFRKKELTPFASRIINSILFKMRQGGYISSEEYITSLEGRFSWEKYVKPEPISEAELQTEFRESERERAVSPKSESNDF